MTEAKHSPLPADDLKDSAVFTKRLNEANARIASLEAQLAEARKALEAYEAAIDEAEAIFGGEYADHYGPMFELAMKARDARHALLHPKPTGDQS